MASCRRHYCFDSRCQQCQLAVDQEQLKGNTKRKQQALLKNKHVKRKMQVVDELFNQSYVNAIIEYQDSGNESMEKLEESDESSIFSEGEKEAMMKKKEEVLHVFENSIFAEPDTVRTSVSTVQTNSTSSSERGEPVSPILLDGELKEDPVEDPVEKYESETLDEFTIPASMLERCTPEPTPPVPDMPARTFSEFIEYEPLIGLVEERFGEPKPEDEDTVIELVSPVETKMVQLYDAFADSPIESTAPVLEKEQNPVGEETKPEETKPLGRVEYYQPRRPSDSFVECLDEWFAYESDLEKDGAFCKKVLPRELETSEQEFAAFCTSVMSDAEQNMEKIARDSMITTNIGIQLFHQTVRQPERKHFGSHQSSIDTNIGKRLRQQVRYEFYTAGFNKQQEIPSRSSSAQSSIDYSVQQSYHEPIIPKVRSPKSNSLRRLLATAQRE